MPQSASTSTSWSRFLMPYAYADNRKAWFQLLTTTALFASTWFIMLLLMRLDYALTLLFVPLGAFFLVRLFIFQHDCGHGSFFTSQKLNDAVGRIIGVITITPYEYWRYTHATHHATSGNLGAQTFGEITTLSVQQYLSQGKWGRMKYRLVRNIGVLLLLGPILQFVIKHRFPYDIPFKKRTIWISIWRTNLFIALIMVVAWQIVGLSSFLMVQAPLTFVSGVMGIWFFYVQHQFRDTYWEEPGTWKFEDASMFGSSFYDLPKILHWFTGNIGFHNLHHLVTKIPNYNLSRCFKETRGTIPCEKNRLTFLTSLKCANLSLWDPQEKLLISFGEMKKYR